MYKLCASIILLSCVSAFSEEPAVKPPAPPDAPAPAKSVKKEKTPIVKAVVKSKKEIQAEQKRVKDARYSEILNSMKRDYLWDALNDEGVLRIKILVGRLVDEGNALSDSSWTQLRLLEKDLIRKHAPEFSPR